MTDKRETIHNNIYFWALALMIVSIPLSKFMMSVAQFILAINWLADFRFIEKFKRFFSNRAAMVLFSFYVMHVIGLIYTNDFNYAFKDLRTKLPILIFAIIIPTTEALCYKKFRLLMLLYVGAILSGTLFSTYTLFAKQIVDIREISIFISHIRFSLNIDLAIIVLIFITFIDKGICRSYRFLCIAVTFWLVIFLFLSESMTGIVILTITTIILIVYYIAKRSNLYYNIGIVVVIVILTIISATIISRVIDDVYHVNPVDFSKLEKYTPYGNEYEHDTLRTSVENGDYVWIYISMSELRDAWNKRSDIDFDSLDKKSQHVSYTLIRFLTSKGLRKDLDGINQLTDEEIQMVEFGIASIDYHDQPGIWSRLHKIIWEYKNVQETNDPSGHSVMQRLEFWRASWGIIKRHPIIGVGTGDMNIVFDDQYRRMNTALEPKYQWRSHNQFLSIFVGFGIIGLLWFFIVLVYPPLKMQKFGDYFYLTFFIIFLLSMMWEDTIESQAGVTFYALFNALFLFGRKPD